MTLAACFSLAFHTPERYPLSLQGYETASGVGSEMAFESRFSLVLAAK